MTKYICKCGRVVTKSTNADNTGNRDTAGCEGCPYLLPWGPMVWDDQQKGYTQNVKGYECRMSPTLEYASTYHGCADDKCSLHIVSLDLDFLDEVQAWIYDNAAYTLRAGFSRGSIRGIEFSDKGRYSLSILCAPNKKGVAAKAALIEHFFGPDKSRRGMTPQQEKAHILAAIEAGKARAQKGENKKVEYIISQNTENGLTYAYYRGAFWFWDERAGRWFLSPHAKELYAGFSAGQPGSKPEDMLCSGNFEALEDWDIPVKVIDDLLSRNPKKEKRENPTDAAEDAQPCAPIASDAPLFPSPSANADVQQGGKDDAANPTDAAPASPADAGAATQSLSAADPASLAAESAQLAFDYSGLDDQTVADLHLAEREYSSGKKMAEMGLRRMADAVAIAHDALCGGCDNLSQAHNNQYSKDTFGAWCESIGIHRKAAERLLQVSKLMDNSNPREQKVLEELSPSLLYAAAKPSAPAELVQAVKDGDITTHKQYQEAMEKLKAERESTSALLADEQRRRQEADTARIAAEKDAARYKEIKDAALETAKQQRERAKKAEQRAREADAAAEEAIAQKDALLKEKWEIAAELQKKEKQLAEMSTEQPVVAEVVDQETIENRAEILAKRQLCASLKEDVEATLSAAEGLVLSLIKRLTAAEMEDSVIAVKMALTSIKRAKNDANSMLRCEEDTNL